MKLFYAVFALLLLVPSFAFAQIAQTATPVQQTATRADAATNCINAAGTAQQTITITPGQNQYVYLVWAGFTAQATTASGAANSITTTTTNLGGLSRVCGYQNTGGFSCENLVTPTTPIRSTTLGTAVTIVSNAAVTNVTFTLSACYYLGS